jgi:hypothetical protein
MNPHEIRDHLNLIAKYLLFHRSRRLYCVGYMFGYQSRRLLSCCLSYLILSKLMLHTHAFLPLIALWCRWALRDMRHGRPWKNCGIALLTVNNTSKNVVKSRNFEFRSNILFFTDSRLIHLVPLSIYVISLTYDILFPRSHSPSQHKQRKWTSLN